MPSLFALLHFNTQSHTKLPTKDLMQPLLHFTAAAFADAISLTRTTKLGWQGYCILYNHIRNFTQEDDNYAG